MALKAIA